MIHSNTADGPRHVRVLQLNLSPHRISRRHRCGGGDDDKTCTSRRVASALRGTRHDRRQRPRFNFIFMPTLFFMIIVLFRSVFYSIRHINVIFDDKDIDKDLPNYVAYGEWMNIMSPLHIIGFYIFLRYQRVYCVRSSLGTSSNILQCPILTVSVYAGVLALELVRHWSVSRFFRCRFS